MKCALSIAGSDPSGGAGIQADIKTMTLCDVYAMSVITALTAQNTVGVYGIHAVPTNFFALQLESVLKDIPPDAVKIGMTYSKDIIDETAALLQKYGAGNIVVDPVMVSTSGKRLLSPEAKEAMTEKLFPLARLITPNLPEAEEILGRKLHTDEEILSAAEEINKKYGCAVLIKGGHRVGGADDLMYYEGGFRKFCGERIDNPNTHGTGCTLSSAIAANLAKGNDLPDSVRLAKTFVSGAIGAGLNLGKGRGPLNHAFELNSRKG